MSSPIARTFGPKLLARSIFQRTLEAVDPAFATERCLSRSGQTLCCTGREYDLRRYHDLRVLVVGKAAHRMLDGLTAILPGEIPLRGLVSAPAPPKRPRSHFGYFASGHPEPNEDSLRAGQAALELLSGCTPETLVIILLSGGGSALMESPLLSTLTLAGVQQLNRALVTCGASINEINTIRKHLSAVKGGRLAQAAHPATILTLAISDVPAGKESALASGPTLPDPTTRADVRDILARYSLRNHLPVPLLAWMDTAMPETPKPGDHAFAKTQFHLVAGMHELFHAAHRIAEAEDCLAFCDNSTDDWPVEKAVDVLLAQLQEFRAANPASRPVALIADGELSSAVTGDGLGGRNSAFVLACVEKIAGKGIVVLSAGTDGMDGNSPAAGAVADGETLARARQAGLDPADFFQRSDSFRFFDKLGDAIVTGPTGNNLRDLRLLIAFPPQSK